MPVDVKTLFLLTVDVEAMLGLLLLFAYVQNTSIKALAWWGSAHLLRTLSIALYGMFGSVPELISLDLSNALLFTSYAIAWSGARVFDGHEPRPGWVITGATVWVFACQLPQFSHAIELRSLLSNTIVTAFLWLTAFEFWRGRDERLLSRWPAIFILFSHGAIFLLRSPLSVLLGPAGDPALASAWMNVISTEEVLATISIAFILLAMAKERTELHHKNAALLDPLTGLANRRAFLDAAAQLTQTQTARDVPVAVFMIDLDRFKSVNDRFGHSVGDEVLRIFAESAQVNLRPTTDIVARLGGEEFAVLLCDACRDNAFKVAERIRSTFAALAATVAGHAVNATASIGVAIIQDPQQDVHALLAQADQALYRAKARGRNRVVVIGLDLFMEGGADDAPAVVRLPVAAQASEAA